MSISPLRSDALSRRGRGLALSCGAGALAAALAGCTKAKPPAQADDAAAHAPAPTASDAAIGAATGSAEAASNAAAPTAAAAPAAAAQADALSPEQAKGLKLYVALCSLCHGRDAKGYAADNAPSLVSRTFLESASDDFLRSSIVHGRPGTAMAAYGAASGGPLQAADVDAIIAWLRRGGPPAKTLPVRDAVGDPHKGEALYTAHCANCHGTPSQRLTAVHLANVRLLEAASDSFLRYAIEQGRPGTPMAAWKDKLDASAIDHLIAYLRSLQKPTPPPLPEPLALPPAPPHKGPMVVNPKGKRPKFELRDDRYAALDDVGKAYKAGRRMIFVDARAPSDWMQMHIKGAVSTPYYQLDSLDSIPNDGTYVIAYCACPHHASGVVVDELRKRGYKHTAVLDEGVFAWEKKGYPVVRTEGTAPAAAPPPLGALPPEAGHVHPDGTVHMGAHAPAAPH
jgi:cytochrome c oxidase cbb3-type subunit 3